MSQPLRDDELGIDWTDDQDPFLVALRRMVFSKMQIEVRPNVFVPYEPIPTVAQVHFPAPGEEWRFYVVFAGQRSGKTLMAMAEGAWRLALPGQRIWYIAPSYDLANRGYEMIHEFVVRQQIHGPGSVESSSKPSNKPEMKSIQMVGGSFFRTKSAENPNSLLGEKLTLAIVDEAALLDEDIWNSYILPRLVNLGGKGLIVSSPRGRNWMAKFWDRGKQKDTRKTGWRSAKFKTEENPYVDREWLEDQRAVTPELTWKRDFEGEPVSQEGQIYAMYRDELMPKGHLYRPEEVQVQKGWTHFLGIDIGIIHPTAAIWGAVDPNGNLWIYKDYLKVAPTHTDHAKNIAALTQYPVTTTWISPDAARTLKLNADASLNAQYTYAEAGIFATPADDAVREGISLVRETLTASLAAPNMTKHQRVYISVECEALRRGLLTYETVGRRGKQSEATKSDLPEKPKKFKDDAVDAFRYLLSGKPFYTQPTHFSEEEGFDGHGREGYRQMTTGAPQFQRPGVDW